jgi:hypothetical protein
LEPAAAQDVAQARFTHWLPDAHCESVVHSAPAMPQVAESDGRQRPDMQLSPLLQEELSLQASTHLARLQTRLAPQTASLSQVVTVPEGGGSVGLVGSPGTG